jgi:hypothetical protein
MRASATCAWAALLACLLLAGGCGARSVPTHVAGASASDGDEQARVVQVVQQAAGYKNTAVSRNCMLGV